MENKGDWTGQGTGKSMAIVNGASNVTDSIRADRDYYATDPQCLEELLKVESFDNNIWECCCGGGHLSNALKEHGFNVKESDIVNRIGNEIIDFLTFPPEFNGDIITNPPYSKAKECVENAIRVIPTGNKVAMFLKLTFLEGQNRQSLFKFTPPPRRCMCLQKDRSALQMETSVKYNPAQYAMLGLCGSKGSKETQLLNGYESWSHRR